MQPEVAFRSVMTQGDAIGAHASTTALLIRVYRTMITGKTSGRVLRRRPAEAPSSRSAIGIGEMAQRFNVSLRTLRFYEHRGLLTPQRENNARLYSESDRTRLQAILRCKQLGFTLTEIRAMIAAGNAEPGAACLEPHREQIRAQIAHLEQQRLEIDDALSALRREEIRLADG